MHGRERGEPHRPFRHALQPRRGDYQEVLARLADERGIARADFAAAFLGAAGPDRASRLRELIVRLGVFSG